MRRRFTAWSGPVPAALLALAAALPAQGQTTVWSATLTVNTDDNLTFGCHSTSADPEKCSNVLTEDQFTFGGKTYSVSQFYWWSRDNELFVEFENVAKDAAKAAFASLTLTVDGTALKISSAGLDDSTPPTDRLYWSFDPSPDWTDGQRVSLSLTQGGTTPSTPGGQSNRAPDFSGPRTFSIPENTTRVGTVMASDPDSGDSITGYTLGGRDANLFMISNDGVLSFRSAPDFENPKGNDGNTYAVSVTVTSGSGTRAMTATRSYDITVTDVADSPGGGGGPPPGGGGPPPGDDGPPPGDDDDDDDDGDPDPDPDPPPAPTPPEARFELDAACGTDGLCVAFTGAPVRFRDTSTGTVATRAWDFGDGAASRAAAPLHRWSDPGFYRVVLAVSGAGERSSTYRDVLVRASDPAGRCEPDAETLCLLDGRFAVRAEHWTEGAEPAAAKIVHAGTNESGMFWFLDEDNWEILIKVLDGCSINEHVWVYGASATTLGYRIRVTDTVTDAVREYVNEDGRRAAAIADSKAFAGACGGSGSSASSPAGGGTVLDPPLPVGVEAASEEGGCTESATTLCLLDGRYEVSVSWSTPPAAGEESGETGPGRVVRARTPDSGLFYFFGPKNWEMLVKVLDGCSYNGHHWVFAASATDLGLDLVVRDTVTGEVRKYVRDPGKPSPAVADLSAFANACGVD